MSNEINGEDLNSLQEQLDQIVNGSRVQGEEARGMGPLLLMLRAMYNIDGDSDEDTTKAEQNKGLYVVGNDGKGNECPISIPQGSLRCKKCRRELDPKSKDYIAVGGNISVGLDTGIVGCNVDQDGKVFSLDAWCCNCIEDLLGYIRHCMSQYIESEKKVIRKLRIPK